MRKHILLIEDHRDIANLVMINLRDSHMQVDHAANGRTGLAMALSGNYQLVILDLMLPGMDGVEVCKALRRDKVYTPVLMLTARTSELDRVLGLEIGADDYLTKPFSIRELVARVNAILRRVGDYQSQAEASESGPLEYDSLRIDADRRHVLCGGREVELTAREFDLLWHFARNPGRVFTRAQLLDSVWGYGHEGYAHTVNSHINRLRSKIEPDPANPRYVLTVWGVGYRFATDDSRGKSA
jgi:DNA-binding response OmpR family regulator